MTISKQQLYSIKDLENFTQIKAHTIRVWEQRYQLLSPGRTDSNIRLYNESDLKKILNIKLLYANGLKISKIAALKEEEIIEKVKGIISNSGNDDLTKWINKALMLILDYDVEKLNKLLKSEFKNQHLESVYLQKVIPLMKTLGELWQVNSVGVSHEHFFSNLLKEAFISQIHGLPYNKNAKSKALLFLHDEEEHEFSILLYYYLMKKAGYTCFYFGQKTPISEIIEIQSQLNPDIIITTFTSHISQKEFTALFQTLKKLSENSEIIISGSQLKTLNFKLTSSLHHIVSLEQLDSLIEKRHTS